MSKETFDPTRYNNSQNEPFSAILEKRISRHDVLKGGAAMAALTLFSSFGLSGCNDEDSGESGISQKLNLGFQSILGSRTDAVAIAEGYTAQVLAPWGTPLNSLAADWRSDGRNTAWDQANTSVRPRAATVVIRKQNGG